MTVALAQVPPRAEPVLGVGDVVRITVYQNPDLTVEARVSELGQINFPLIGVVTIGGLSVSQAQALIEKRLRDGGFVLKPQVTIQTTQIRSSQVSILGQVGKPGRFPIEIVGSKVSEMIAAAGGVVPAAPTSSPWSAPATASRSSSTSTCRSILQQGRADLDVPVENGDIIYVDRAPTFYMYGEVQRPGQLRLERGMTLMQALAAGRRPDGARHERGIQVHRKDAAAQSRSARSR